MSCLGVHFAITRPKMDELVRLASRRIDPDERDEGVLACVHGIEEVWDEDNLFQWDKAWDAIHRCLTGDHTPKGRLNARKGSYPLKRCILGGRMLYRGQDYSVSLVEPEHVPGLAKAVKAVDEAWMRERFFRLDPKALLYRVDEDEFEYTWGNYKGFPEFLAKAARRHRAVIFTVDH